MLVRRGRATGYRAGNGSVSRAASNQQFTRTSRGCDGVGFEGLLGRRLLAARQCQYLGPVATVSGQPRGSFSIGPSCGERLKWQHVSLWRAGLHFQHQHARLAAVGCAEKDNNTVAAQRLALPCSYPAADGGQTGNQQELAALCDSQGAPLVDIRPTGTGMWRLLANLLFPSCTMSAPEEPGHQLRPSTNSSALPLSIAVSP
jgi:hypothetical protein